MHTAIARVQSTAPYSQSKPIMEKRKPKETADDHEQRTWRERMHVDKNGEVYIPATAWKNGIAEAAKYLSIQIPGKGKATYTKHFEAGVLVVEHMPLGIKAADVIGENLFVPSDGKRGGGSRVWKVFPRIDSWTGDVTFQIFDDTITEDVFRSHLVQMGQFIGLGRFRPRNNGFYGRFSVEEIVWK